MRLTTNASTGHLAMFQIVTAVPPSPICFPIASASGPETTSAMRTSARTCSGRSFQNGRPSGFSKMALEARMNAPMYPDADHSAPSRPTPRSAPAPPLFWTTLLIVFLRVSSVLL